MAQTLELTLSPQSGKMIENNYMWSLNATCQIQCKKNAQRIVVSVIKNSSKVNGKSLSKGQKTTFIVHNHDAISVSAEPGAKVNVRNEGSDLVQASCSA